jgi:hypothetical protein
MLLFATVPTLSNAPMQLQRSPELQSSILVVDLKNEVRFTVADRV